MSKPDKRLKDNYKDYQSYYKEIINQEKVNNQIINIQRKILSHQYKSLKLFKKLIKE